MELSVVNLELRRNNGVQTALIRICESNQFLQNVSFTDILHANQNL